MNKVEKYGKTKEELNQLKNEYKTLNNKLKELTDDELKQVTGGINVPISHDPRIQPEIEPLSY